VLRAGSRTSPASFLTSSSLIFLAPQWGFSRLVSTISRSTGSGSWLAYLTGRRERSQSA
jgi:hypothetical protein